WFFDEWVYKAGHPIFNVSYQWNDSAKAIFLSVKQTQKLDSLTGVFHTPVDIEVTSSAGKATHRLNIMNKDTAFTIPSPSKPQLVVFDKGNWLIKELKFEKSREEWKYQAESASNPVDRIRALQELARLPDNEEFIPLFASLSLRDPFWAVRREAISSFGKINTKNDSLKEQIKAALVAAYQDRKPSVRSSVISQLGKFKGSDVVSTLRAALNDSSYSVISSALRSLTKVDSANALATLTAYLDVPSYNNSVANTALSILSSVDSAKAVTTALTKSKYGQPLFTRFTALNILSRYGKGRQDVLELFQSLLNDKNAGIKSTAVRALGEV
ncbi:MAG: HEAT repeat domain-containing protein, partial [Bacteroidota bacterium]